MKEKILRAKELAKLLGLEYVTYRTKTNGFGGYNDHHSNGKVVLEKDGRIVITCTCRNCGDGSDVNVDKLLNFITS